MSFSGKILNSNQSKTCAAQKHLTHIHWYVVKISRNLLNNVESGSIVSGLLYC